MRYLIYFCTVSCLLTACKYSDKEKNGITKKGADEEMTETDGKTTDYWMDEKEKFMKEFEAKKDHTIAKIDKLRVKLVDTKQNKKKAFEEKIENLEERQKEIEEKMKNFKNASEKAYGDIKLGIDTAFSELDKAIDEAKKEFD